MTHRFLVTICLLALTLGGCGSPPRGVLVLAAASLSPALEEIRLRWESDHPGVALHVSVGASSTLQQQVERGAPADVYIAAASGPMDELEAAGQLEPGSRREIAQNRIVAIARVASDAATLESLIEEATRVGIGDVGVPVGEYARAALARRGVLSIVEPKLIHLAHEPAVLQAVRRGAVDWGVVYASSAATSDLTVVAEFPGADPVRYPAAVLRRAANPTDARAFLEFLGGPHGRSILQRHGFAPGAGAE